VTIEVAVTEVASLEEVERTRWDAVVGNRSFYLSHDWLTAQDRGQPVNARYMLATLAGRLVGVLPSYVVDRETNDSYRTDRLLGGRWPGRYVIAGARRAYTNDLLIAANLKPSDHQRVGDALLAALRARVERERTNGALFPYLGTAATERLLGLCSDTRPLLTSAEAVLDVPADGLDGYVRSLPGKRRTAVRRERRCFLEAGYRATMESAAQHWSMLVDPFVQLQRRYGHEADHEYGRRVLRRQAEALAEHAYILGAWRDEDPTLVAGVLLYLWRDTLYVRLAGFDYPRLNKGGFEYFNLCCYEPIRIAAQRGLRQLHLGRESLRAKVLRGARLRPLWCLHLPADPRDERDRDAATWNAWSSRELADQVPQAAFTDPGWRRWGAEVGLPPL
jgi:uncharacterized protein